MKSRRLNRKSRKSKRKLRKRGGGTEANNSNIIEKIFNNRYKTPDEYIEDTSNENEKHYYLYSFFLLNYFRYIDYVDMLDDPISYQSHIRRMKNYNLNIKILLNFLNEKEFYLNIQDDESFDTTSLNKTIDSILSEISEYSKIKKKKLYERTYYNKISDHINTFRDEVVKELDKDEIEKIKNLQWNDIQIFIRRTFD